MFAAAFIEDEVFKVLIFNKYDIIMELDVNEIIGLKDGIKPIDAVLEPLMNVVYMDETCIFVVCYNHLKRQVWYFGYNIIKKKYITEPRMVLLECYSNNFPIKSFYDKRNDLIHSFFRQGQVVSIDPTHSFETQISSITNFNLGEMEIYDEKVLMVKSSQIIELYHIDKLKNDLNNLPLILRRKTNSKSIKWVKYHTLNKEGFVIMNPLTRNFQVICDELIYFYEFPDNQDKAPIPFLTNTMQNFMLCN